MCTERLTDLVPDLEIHIIPDSNIITIYLVGVMIDVHSDQRLYLQRNQFCHQCSAV